MKARMWPGRDGEWHLVIACNCHGYPFGLSRPTWEEALAEVLAALDVHRARNGEKAA